jgi:hypothetical protein
MAENWNNWVQRFGHEDTLLAVVRDGRGSQRSGHNDY